ncbi:MAG: FAD-linked oxidase C-terminal domain-containing protein, partial [Hydrogenophaga sp.]|nr:FAD-linked oxidase C-terminal domain-containing protein [Hydrogenophaga sp.]
LTRLFVGSEGTLGVMTEITLKLYPLPEAVSAAICHFPSIDAAVRTTIQVIQIGVPISRLADCLLDSVAEADASGIPYFLVGHVGDGNFHFGYLIDPAIPEERERAEVLNNQLVARALRLEGTCTGEHGVGLHKMDFLLTEAGSGAVDMMRSIKRALDPDNILNPGKIFAL